MDKLGKLNLWTGVLARRQLEFNHQQHRKNREAEESHARRVAWGWKGDSEVDDMGDTYLGDVTIQPTTQAAQQRSGWPLVAGLALASAIPTGAYLWSKQNSQAPVSAPEVSDPTDQPVFDDNSVRIGLGRIEDFDDPS